MSRWKRILLLLSFTNWSWYFWSFVLSWPFSRSKAASLACFSASALSSGPSSPSESFPSAVGGGLFDDPRPDLGVVPPPRSILFSWVFSFL
eukprot:CAMPEP_0204300120 /NCGR_PEP_ID=MMETSP0468-20130131/78017_1 /ASSEMBLY_ACC=CAM_ASM_000383 /TAXON_ID=2969 /ORGANISM="Oxyrrhis marina" /LENGTH=90 /DNA_ID=CAMNT_0051279151 /DNA_START=193 /DNA_END=465 /DNA_ORIENTATION=+